MDLIKTNVPRLSKVTGYDGNVTERYGHWKYSKIKVSGLVNNNEIQGQEKKDNRKITANENPLTYNRQDKREISER